MMCWVASLSRRAVFGKSNPPRSTRFQEPLLLTVTVIREIDPYVSGVGGVTKLHGESSVIRACLFFPNFLGLQ